MKNRTSRHAFDAGERLVEELAPELVPMLTAQEMPANFVPVTNAVLSEMARRGVSRWPCHPQPDIATIMAILVQVGFSREGQRHCTSMDCSVDLQTMWVVTLAGLQGDYHSMQGQDPGNAAVHGQRDAAGHAAHAAVGAAQRH